MSLINLSALSRVYRPSILDGMCAWVIRDDVTLLVGNSNILLGCHLFVTCWERLTVFTSTTYIYMAKEMNHMEML